MNIIPTVCASIAATIIIAAFGCSGDKEMIDFGIIFGVIVGLCVYMFVEKMMKEKKEEQKVEIQNDEKRFENGEMTGVEREKYVKRKLKYIDYLYEHNSITFAQREELIKKYTGKSAYLDALGAKKVKALSDKMLVDRAIEQHKKDAETDLMLNTTFGNAIGGISGAMYGATNSLQHSAEKAEELERLRLIAEENLRNVEKEELDRIMNNH